MPSALSLTYTVIGTGGLSAAIPGVSSQPFWWVDTTGTTPASDVIARGFTPFPAFVKVVDDLKAGGGGSLLLSSSFALSAGATLTVKFKLLKKLFSYAHADQTAPLGFALLVRAGLPPIVLANVTAENLTFFNNQQFLGSVPVGDTTFAPVAPGVTVTPTLGNGLDVSLNGAHYAAVPGVAGLCGCFLDVVSKVTPGAGTYQLLFGIYDFVSGGTASIPDLNRGALTVTAVRSVRRPRGRRR